LFDFSNFFLNLYFRLIEILKREGLNEEGSPIVIQCFEKKTLKYLKKNLEHISLVQLVKTGKDNMDGTISNYHPYDNLVYGINWTSFDILSPQGLDKVATYAHGIGKISFFVVFFYILF
jgi:glycerophosphoryl diester phosphodiesterase